MSYDPTFYEEWRESEFMVTEAEHRVYCSEVRQGSQFPSAAEVDEVCTLRALAALKLRQMLQHMKTIAEGLRLPR